MEMHGGTRRTVLLEKRGAGTGIGGGPRSPRFRNQSWVALRRLKSLPPASLEAGIKTLTASGEATVLMVTTTPLASGPELVAPIVADFAHLLLQEGADLGACRQEGSIHQPKRGATPKRAAQAHS